jgi:PKD repeat protein
MIMNLNTGDWPSGDGLLDDIQVTSTEFPSSTISYTWSFGDGGTANGAAVTHTYESVGVFTAVVTASNSLSLITATTPVTVSDIPISGLAAFNDGPTLLGNSTTLTAAVAAGSNVQYDWSLGDGTFGEGAVITYTYAEAGSFTAVVTASNPINRVTTTTAISVVVPQVSFHSPNYSVGEHEGQAVITVTLSEPVAVTASVAFSVSGGTASAGSDFAAVSGRVTFAGGITTSAFWVPVYSDTLREQDETVLLVLDDAENASLGETSSATLLIIEPYWYVYLPLVLR